MRLTNIWHICANTSYKLHKHFGETYWNALFCGISLGVIHCEFFPLPKSVKKVDIWLCVVYAFLKQEKSN